MYPDKKLFDKISNIRSDIPTLKDIYTFDLVDGAKSMIDFLALGDKNDMKKVEEIKTSIQPESLATIIYTSGTTGNPKYVMLSASQHIVSNIKGVWNILPVDHTKHVLSFLPLCHIFERMVVYIYMARGTSVYYAESMDTIAVDSKGYEAQFLYHRFRAYSEKGIYPVGGSRRH